MEARQAGIRRADSHGLGLEASGASGLSNYTVRWRWSDRLEGILL